MKKKSIIINGRSHKELSKLSEAFGSTLGGLVESMILYFQKTGINPKDAINQNPSVMVSFLKVQERDILKPIKDEVYINGKNHQNKIEELTQSLKNLLNKMNSADEQRTEYVQGELQKTQRILFEISNFLDSKGRSGLNNRIKEIIQNASK